MARLAALTMQNPTPTKNLKSRKQRFPLGLFVVAFAISITTTCLMLWQAHEMQERGYKLDAQHATLTQNIADVMLYDEVLTMSARLCAATGDFAYEKRYDEYDHKLTVKIADLRGCVSDGEAGELIAVTDAANTKLVELERQSFELAHAGDGKKGLWLLEGSQYANLKQTFASGMVGTALAAERERTSSIGSFARGCGYSLR